MFTIVDSNDKKTKQTSYLDASSSLDQKESTLTEDQLSFAKKVKNLFLATDEYLKLQLGIYFLTFVISIFVSFFTTFLVNPVFGLSIFVGSIAGIFYLRLLAKGIGNLGKTTSGVSKFQLLIPICLFIFASKIELIEVFPAIIGFFFYKPALIFYFSRY